MTHHIKGRLFVSAALTFGAFVGVYGGPAFAQTDTAEETRSGGRDEIIVTARKREESLQDVPAAVSAITGKGLEEIGAESFADYAGTIPGLLFQDLQVGASGRGQQAVIRGVTSGLGASLFSQATVAVYLDDLSIPTFFDPEPVDLERIEVLRGPQGTLYGDRALGGAIKFITAKPDLNNHSTSAAGSVSFTRFSDDPSYRANGVVNIPIVEDKLAIRLVAAFNNQSGFIDSDGSDPFDVVDASYVGEDINSREQLQFRGKVLWIPTDKLDVLGTIFYEENTLSGSPNFDPTKPELTTTALFAPDPNDRKSLAANIRLDYDLGWADLVSTTSYLEDETSIFLSLTAFFQPFVENLAGFVAGAPVDFREPFRTQEMTDSKVFTHEMRIHSKNEGPLNYMLGLYYFNSEFVGQAAAIQPGLAPFNGPGLIPFGLVGDGSDVAFDFSGSGGQSEIAGFGEIVLDLLDNKLQLTAGGRVFRTESEGFGTDGVQSASATDTDFILRFSGSYKANDDTLLYLQAAQGYRGGGGNVPIPMPPANFSNAFAADSLWTYEFGLKTSFWDKKVTTNVAAFYTDWDDIQSQITSPGGFLFVANAGSAQNYGVEFELFSNPFENFNLSGSFSYLIAEIAEDVPELGLVDGQRLPGTPKFTGSVTANYTHALTDKINLVPAVLWTYRGESFSGFGVNQGTSLDAFSRLNLSLSLRDDTNGWSIRIFADNLTDSRPTLSPFTFRTVPQFATIRPRTIGVSFAKRFLIHRLM